MFNSSHTTYYYVQQLINNSRCTKYIIQMVVELILELNIKNN